MTKIFEDEKLGYHVRMKPDNPTAQQVADAAEWLLTKATEVSEETGKEISFSPTYGMGGTYTPTPKAKLTKDEALKLLKDGVELTEEQRTEIAAAIESAANGESYWDDSYAQERYGWVSSSYNC
jgi:hypothetical protein